MFGFICFSPRPFDFWRLTVMLAMSAIHGGLPVVWMAGRHACDGRGVDDGGEFHGVF